MQTNLRKLIIVILIFPIVQLIQGAACSSQQQAFLAEEYETYLSRQEDMLKNDPSYVASYMNYLTSEPNLQREDYEVAAKPAMDLNWQKIVQAGYPEQLKFFLNEFQKCSDRPEKLNETKSLFLLFGSPDTGKSSAARLIAMILKRPFLKIRCSGIRTEPQGSPVINLEKILKPIFESYNPWVVCLNEIETLQGDRSRALAMLPLLNYGNRNPNLILIGTTNSNEKIPMTTLHKIGSGAIKFSLPDYEARKKIAKLLLEKRSIVHSDEIVDILARASGGMFPTLMPRLSIQGINNFVSTLETLLDQTKKQDVTALEREPRIATPDITRQAIQ